MIRRLTKREFRIFVVCVFMFFIYAGYNCVVKPMRGRISFLERKIAAQELKLKKSLKIIRSGKQYKNQYIKYLAKFGQLKSNEEVMSSILSEIEEAAGKLNLRISDLKPKKVKKGQYFNRFSVSLTINSNFENILNFIHALQDQPHLFNVEELRFDKGSRRKTKTLKTRLVLSRILISKN